MSLLTFQLPISTAACVVPGRVWSAAAYAVPTVPEVACPVKRSCAGNKFAFIYVDAAFVQYLSHS
jgi:hypothetical protein